MTADAWTFGFDRGSFKAWRKPIGNPRAAPELAECIYVNPGDKDSEMARAVWRDAFERRIPELSKEDWLAKQSGKPGKRVAAPRKASGSRTAPIFQSTHKPSGDMVRCTFLKGEQLISVRMKSAGSKEKQIVQVSLHSCGGSVDLATNLARALATKFCTGKLKMDSLKAERDLMVRDLAKVAKPVVDDDGPEDNEEEEGEADECAEEEEEEEPEETE